MADKRKLQLEIDRCLKTVSERLEIFQETWDKVGLSGSHSIDLHNSQCLLSKRNGWVCNNGVWGLWLMDNMAMGG